MYSVIYILIAFIVAVFAGIWLYREHQAEDSLDYILAIAIGLLWPVSAMMFVFVKCLDAFKDLCVCISDGIDDVEKKRLEKEAARSTEP